ncbi:hypothetical protein IEQ34_015916 [Dendrobium chrysotoxum]|uniref:RING-type domain-containing protein n=1 Tax=Dendrobium chrysotoxum TaxID=161865 RepID=A0AAV7GJS3_DENCH|nr:hypothetical protein IEQ34_015916 [Dendrobium chrysotoxum]
MSYATILTIAVLFLIATMTLICYLFCFPSTVPRPLQPEHSIETRLDDGTWPHLTYAEAKRQHPRAATAGCCAICQAEFDDEEEGEDEPLRLLPDCGHLFHAICIDQWLQQHTTCPVCRSLVMAGATPISS